LANVRFESRYAKLNPNSRICKKCNIEFKEGEIIFRKKGGGKRKPSAYHVDCWSKLEY